MKCHATRFSAAAAVIGLTSFANISARCCGNLRSGSINLRHAFAHLLPLPEMVSSDRCKGWTWFFGSLPAEIFRTIFTLSPEPKPAK